MLLTMPMDLDPASKLLLSVLFSFVHSDGGGIFVGTESLCKLTGMPRSTLFRHISILTERGILLEDGWEHHGGGKHTKRRRIDFEAMRRQRQSVTTKSPGHSPTGETLQNPTGGTRQSATRGTQTFRGNQERVNRKKESLSPSDSGSAQAERERVPRPPRILFDEGLPPLLRLGMCEKQARKVAGGVFKIIGHNIAETLELLAEVAERLDPIADERGGMLAAAEFYAAAQRRATQWQP